MALDPRSPAEAQRPEPLLSLLTSQHPLVANTINRSLSAYTSSKSYSPRFRSSAEFVERNIACPVASTVSTAGRISGVESGVRWWLQRNESGTATPGNKRRRESNETDVERGSSDLPALHRTRTASDLSQTEYLPAYDDKRSPVYEEYPSALSQQQQQQHRPGQSPALQTWQTRLMVSTSGLGVAMSDESLRSLKYCLSWLRWANNHLSKVLSSLQSVLEEWDRSQRSSESNDGTEMDASGPGSRPAPRDQAAITSHLHHLKTDCVETLKKALDVVARYAGGALPENAALLVRRHLTSLPQRFHKASISTSAESDNGGSMEDREKQAQPEVVTGAQRVKVLAKEGLDMMAQVTAVVNGTIISAEDWCERLGKKKSGSDEREESMQLQVGDIEKERVSGEERRGEEVADVKMEESG